MASKHMWILWFALFIWKLNYLNCYEIQKNAINEVNCEYDTVSGGQDCDCNFENVVCFKINVSYSS